MSRRSLQLTTALATAVLCAGLFTGISAASTSPSVTKSFQSPGSATQIRKLVAASSKITSLTTQTRAQVASPQAAWMKYDVANGCSTASQCVFGDTKSRKTVVMFGDSHAIMWLPAMDWIAKADKLRLVLLSAGNCPAIANVAGTNVLNKNCAAFHTSSIRIINSLHPIAVVISELTVSSAIKHSDGTRITESEWQAGLTTTIKEFKSKVALIEDVVYFDIPVPICLAANVSNVQACSVHAPNPKNPGQQAAEQAAAKATGATFVKTWPWFCTTTCSPIVGNTMTYFDWDHITTGYSAYLSKVLRSALAKVL